MLTGSAKAFEDRHQHSETAVQRVTDLSRQPDSNAPVSSPNPRPETPKHKTPNPINLQTPQARTSGAGLYSHFRPQALSWWCDAWNLACSSSYRLSTRAETSSLDTPSQAKRLHKAGNGQRWEAGLCPGVGHL